MSKEKIRRTVATGLSFLVMACMVLVQAEAWPDGVVGGTQPGMTNKPSTGEGTTDVWGGITVDYMFPLRYEVYDEGEQPLPDVSIEHYDYNAKEYVFVGRTDANGVWETEVPPSYWMHNIQGIEFNEEQRAAVVDTGLYTGDGALRHRVSKDGYVIVEGLAEVVVENFNGKATGRVIIHMKKEAQPEVPGPDTPGQETPKPTVPVTSATLPSTGVQNYWIYFAAGSLLLLVAAIILYKVLREEKKKQRRGTQGGQAK